MTDRHAPCRSCLLSRQALAMTAETFEAGAYFDDTVMLLIVTGVLGLSLPSRGTLLMASATSWP